MREVIFLIFTLDGIYFQYNFMVSNIEVIYFIELFESFFFFSFLATALFAMGR